MRMRLVAAAVFAVGITLGPAFAQAPPHLSALGADPRGTSISGLSSGAAFTVQFQIAYSASLVGSGVVAGVPFWCASSSRIGALPAIQATTVCMNAQPVPPDAERLADAVRSFARDGKVDPIQNLLDARVYLFGGTKDSVVKPLVFETLKGFFIRVGVLARNTKVVGDIPAGHALVTPDFGVACGENEAPFISDCDYDQAGDLLQHIYGPAPLKAPTGPAKEALVPFSQAEFLADPRRHGMDDVGFVYVPAACRTATTGTCRVHVAMHGCLQGRETLGDEYATRTGYNRWADANDLIILYPQAIKLPLTNPQGCWDWFAYDDPNYFTKDGRQMKAVKGMIDRLTSPRP